MTLLARYPVAALLIISMAVQIAAGLVPALRVKLGPFDQPLYASVGTIFEERSHHVSTALRYLPAIARRLHHCRELGEPFDFLTWFEYAPEHAIAFEELVGLLRASEEWAYVEREVDIRLSRRAS